VKDYFLVIQRALLLLWTGIRFSSGPIARKILRLPSSGDGYAVRIRKAFEELGLTYLKLGQFLAMRYDILPAEVCRELSKLFEDVQPMSLEEARVVVETELGGPLEELFLYFNPEPIAAASVAQVYEARTLQNEKVAVKIQRPGIDQTFTSDMRILRRIANLIDWSGLAGRLSITEMSDEFANWTQRELNFITEAHTADRLREFALPFEIVPKIYWELTTSKVLTLEFVAGISLSQVGNLLEKGEIEQLKTDYPHLQLEQAYHNLAFASMHQLFEIGFFHGDPHPGNILVRDDNTVAFIDFGIFGSLTESERETVAGFVESLAIGDVDGGFYYYSKELIPTEETDLITFELEAKSVLQQWRQVTTNPDLPLAERHLGKYIGDMIAISRRNHLRMGMEYLLFWRTLNALDSTILRLSAQFDLLSELRLFFEQTRGSFASQALELKMDKNRAAISADLMFGLPDQLRVILNTISRGRSEWPVYTQETVEVRRSKDREVKLTAAVILVLSLVTLAAAATWSGLIRLAVVAIVAVTFGWLLYSMAESRL
jgi:ubiquinone biosynthesis protein